MRTPQAFETKHLRSSWRYWSATAAIGISVICSGVIVTHGLQHSVSNAAHELATASSLLRAAVWFSFITALFTAWLSVYSEEYVPKALLAICLGGAVASVVLMSLALANSDLSLTQILGHASYLIFCWLSASLPRAAIQGPRIAIIATCTGSLVAAALYVAVSEAGRIQREQVASDLFRQQAELASQAALNEPKSTAEPDAGKNVSRPSSNSTLSNSKKPNGTLAYQPRRRGPSKAKAQFVLYCDYDSADCRRLNLQLREMLQEHTESVSVVIRHYPATANGSAPLEDIFKADSCRSALIAEAGFQLQGETGFWRVHDWLLDSESRTPSNLEPLLEVLELPNVIQFSEAMVSPRGQSQILADVVESRSRGVLTAPALLLNGQKLNLLDPVSVQHALEAVLTSATEKPIDPSQKLAQAIDPTATGSFPAEMQLAAALATVRVINPQGRAVGSGVVFARQGTFAYVLTAAHVVENSQTVEVQTFSEESYPNSSQSHSWCAVVAASAVSDLAVLRFSTRAAAPTPVRIIPKDKIPASDEIPCITTGCDRSEAPPTCALNQITAARSFRRNASDPASEMWETTRTSIEGRSGGALIDKNKFIVGVASGNSDDKGYFCHANELHRFLDSHGLTDLLKSP